MYLDFFGLKQPPFSVTPDPDFLYLTPGHREALAQLVYGVQERKGFIVLTGDIGTGKTTLLHSLRRRLDGNVIASFISNSTLPFEGILEYMLSDFGISKSGESPTQRLIALNNFLIERFRSGQNTILIVDDAQNLDPATLEQIRLLSNFETSTDKLLQILLVGQPELRAKLQLPGLRQLRQRIGLSCSIPPLTAEETGAYIRSRLRIAGARDPKLFTDSAVNRIAKYAAGIPRVVNILGDHCLLFGYTEQQRRIDRDIVDRAIEYLEEGHRPARRSIRLTLPRFAVGAALTALLAGISILVLLR